MGLPGTEKNNFFTSYLGFNNHEKHCEELSNTGNVHPCDTCYIVANLIVADPPRAQFHRIDVSNKVYAAVHANFTPRADLRTAEISP